MKKRIIYLILFSIILISECLIAIFLKQGFTRENVGDILVVPCIYTIDIKDIICYIIGFISIIVVSKGIKKYLRVEED